MEALSGVSGALLCLVGPCTQRFVSKPRPVEIPVPRTADPI
jgi:hypothetical protein